MHLIWLCTSQIPPSVIIADEIVAKSKNIAVSSLVGKHPIIFQI